jgi:hypothetical protein
VSEPEDQGGNGDSAGTAPSGVGFGRRLMLVTAAVLLVLLGAGSSVLWVYQWWLDRPVNQALETSGDAVSEVLQRLDDAKTLEDVSAAGALAPKSAESVGRAMESLRGETSHLTDDAQGVLAGQLALLEAIAPMEDLDVDSLMVWGVAVPQVEGAQAALEESASALARLDKGAEARIPDTRAATSQAAQVVGGVAVTSLTDDLENFVDELGKVSTTKQAAAVGQKVDGLDDAADAVAGGQDEDTATELEQLSIGLGAIAGLAEMDPTSLYLWDRTRSSLIPTTERLGIDATASAASMTRWVTAAQQKVDAWQVEYDAAVARRTAATSALDTYSQAVKKIMGDYERGRDELSDVLEDADLDEEYYIGWEVSSAMEDGLATRKRLLGRAQNAVPPESMRAAHQSLVGVLQAAVSAMETGDGAIQDFNNCYLDCTPLLSSSGWQQFSSGSGAITEDYNAARTAWNRALEAALRQVDAVPLPAAPRV